VAQGVAVPVVEGREAVAVAQLLPLREAVGVGERAALAEAVMELLPQRVARLSAVDVVEALVVAVPVVVGREAVAGALPLAAGTAVGVRERAALPDALRLPLPLRVAAPLALYVAEVQIDAVPEALAIEAVAEALPLAAGTAESVGEGPPLRVAAGVLLTLRDASDRRRLLDSFGIMVVPAPLGEFEHNAALHVVTPGGQLVRIVDLSRPDEALATAVSLAASASAAR
jgi:hypothetical protein